MGKYQEQGTFSVLLVGNFEQDMPIMDVVLPEIRFLKTFSNTFEQAFDICACDEFDLVFVEFSLPELEMADYIATIRENHLNTEVPIVAVVDSAVKSVSASVECGCDDTLVRPLDQKILGRKVWRCLEPPLPASDDVSRRLLSFIEGNPAYYSEIEAFVQRLPEQIDDIGAVYDSQLLQNLAARILANMQGEAVVNSADGKPCLPEIDDIFIELDKMAQACLTAQFKTDCSNSDGQS